jgi:N-ethylmaleimide reductase
VTDPVVGDEVDEGLADVVAFISNPDIVERLRLGVPLAPADASTFDRGDARGYTDYATLAAAGTG